MSKTSPQISLISIAFIFSILYFSFALADLIFLKQSSEESQFAHSPFWQVRTQWDKYGNELRNTQRQGFLPFGFFNFIEFQTPETDNQTLTALRVIFIPEEDSYLHIQFRKNEGNFYTFIASTNPNHETGFRKFKNFQRIASTKSEILFEPRKPQMVEILFNENTFTAKVSGKTVAQYTDDEYSAGQIGLSASFPRVILEEFEAQFQDSTNQERQVFRDNFNFVPTERINLSLLSIEVLGATFLLLALLLIALTQIGLRDHIRLRMLVTFFICASIPITLSIFGVSFLINLGCFIVFGVIWTAWVAVKSRDSKEKSINTVVILFLSIALAALILHASFETEKITAPRPDHKVQVLETRSLELGNPIEGDNWNFRLQFEMLLPPRGFTEFRFRGIGTEDLKRNPVFVISGNPEISTGLGFWQNNHLQFKKKLDSPLPGNTWVPIELLVEGEKATALISGQKISAPLPNSEKNKWLLAALTPGIQIRNFLVTPGPEPGTIHRIRWNSKTLSVAVLGLAGLLYVGCFLGDFRKRKQCPVLLVILLGCYLIMAALTCFPWGWTPFWIVGSAAFGTLFLLIQIFRSELFTEDYTFRKGFSLYLALLSIFFTVEIALGTLAETSSVPLPHQVYTTSSGWFLDPMNRRSNQTLNAFSFVERRWSEKVPAGKTRILCVGSSSTAQGYNKDLQKILDPSEKRFEVLNGGVPGTVLFRIYENLKNYLKHFEPDIVILSVGRNDTRFMYNIHDSNLRSYTRSESPRKTSSVVVKIQKVLRFSNLYRYFVKGYRDKYSAFIDNPTKQQLIKSLILFKDDLEHIIQVSKENNIRLLLVPEPEEVLVSLHPNRTRKFRYTRMVEVMQRVGEIHGVPVVDTSTPFFENRGDFLFIDDVHYTPRGQELLAETIDKKLKALGW